MRSLTHEYLDRLAFTATEAATLRQLGEHRGREALYARQRPEVLEALRTLAVVESSESSNRLEGITVPSDRLQRLVLEQTRPENRSEQEVAGYRDALNLIHEAGTDMPISVNVIRQLHTTVYRYVPAPGGEWKPVDNEIVERASDGTILRVRFRPVPAVRVSEAMETLVAEHRRRLAEGRHDPLVLVPLVVLDFLCVHPFADGNGRVARLLTLLLLYHAGYRVGRWISLERIFEQTRESYYETLEASSRGWHDAAHDTHPWLGYFWGVLLRAYREFEERVGTLNGGRGAKSRRVREAVARRVRPFRISDLEMDCPGISRETIRLVLREMRDEGLLVAEGRGRGARWRAVERP